MRKKIAAVLVVSTSFVYLSAVQEARSDELKSGTYEQPGAVAPPAQPVQPVQPAQPAQPGVSGTEGAPTVSTAEKGELAPRGLQTEGLAFAPQAGIINYKDTHDNTGNRAMFGMTTDFNVSRIISDSPSLFIGPQFGLFYSHLGTGDADFFGSSPSSSVTPANGGTNALMIPTDLKIGYTFGNFRTSIHAGANLFYRSNQSGFALGTNPNTSTSSGWKYLPNVGLDFELGLAKNVALIARPDLTFSGSNRVWAGSLGLSFPIG